MNNNGPSTISGGYVSQQPVQQTQQPVQQAQPQVVQEGWISGKCTFDILSKGKKGGAFLRGFIVIPGYQESFNFISFNKRVTDQLLMFTNGVIDENSKNILKFRNIHLYGSWEDNNYNNKVSKQFKTNDLIIEGFESIQLELKEKYDILENKGQGNFQQASFEDIDQKLAHLNQVYPNAPESPYTQNLQPNQEGMPLAPNGLPNQPTQVNTIPNHISTNQPTMPSMPATQVNTQFNQI